MKDRIAQLITSFFGLGYFPFAAGSIASAIGGLAAYYLYGNVVLYVLLFVIVTVAGFIFSARMEKVSGEKDPSAIVIDEVSGAMIAFFLLPMSWPVFWTTFFVFRAFDMCKIYPADIYEQKPGALGVMSDDLIAGIYTNLIMQVAIRLAGLN
jgi:phosphatidylglycerophosphatase A